MFNLPFETHMNLIEQEEDTSEKYFLEDLYLWLGASVTRMCFPPSQTVAWAGWTWQWVHLGSALATKETAAAYIWTYE